MTIDGARKRAIRQRQARTGEPYSIAARKTGRITMIPILSDLRLPLHNRLALASICAWLRHNACRLDEVHLMGAVADVPGLANPSESTPRSRHGLITPIDRVRQALDEISGAFPGRKTFLAPQVVVPTTPAEVHELGDRRDIGALDVSDVLSAAGWVAVETPYAIASRVQALNGIAVRPYSGYTAHAHLERFDANVVHGHTHRAGIVYRTIGNRTRWAMEVGHLSSLEPTSPDWQLGFGILHIQGDEVAPQFVRIKPKGTFMWGARRWAPKGAEELVSAESGRRR